MQEDNPPVSENDESNFDWSKLEAQAAAIDGEDSPEITPATEPEQEISSAELVGQAIQVMADVVAPNWEIKPKESEQLGVVYGALLDKYMPESGFDKYGLEISALLVTGMVLKSRSGISLRKPKNENEKTSQISAKSTVDASHQQVVSGVLSPKAVKNA
jgi:hypothetical protein